MFLEIIEDYKALLRNVDKLVKLSGYKISYICKCMQMDTTSFYLKRKKASFTVDELESLLKILKVEEFEDRILGELSLEAEKNSETIRLSH